jgi:hypothetical protein
VLARARHRRKNTTRDRRPLLHTAALPLRVRCQHFRDRVENKSGLRAHFLRVAVSGGGLVGGHRDERDLDIVEFNRVCLDALRR